MSYLSPPLPNSPSSPWGLNRKNKSNQDVDRSSGDSEHEDPGPPQPSGIDTDGRKKIFGVSLSIAAPQPALRKIKYKVDKKDGSKDKITAKQLLLNTRLSATVAAIEEEKKKDSIIADLSQQRASEIAQSIQEKRDKEEKWKYGGRGRHRTFKKIWTPHPRSKHKRPRGSKSRSRSGSRGRKEKKRSESPKNREVNFKDWASWKAATANDLEEYRRRLERQERKLEKNASKGKLPSSMDVIKPVFDLTDTVIRPRSLLAYPREGSALVSYPLINVHFTEAQPTVKWSPHPKSDRVFYPTRKIFKAHANREQLELFSFIADSRTRQNVFDDVPKTERPWYPSEFLDLYIDRQFEYLPNVDPKNVTIIVESVDEKVAAAKKAIMDIKQAILKKDEEVKPPQPAPFLSSFRPVLGTPDAKPEEPEKIEEPQEQLVSEYEAFLKMVSDKDIEARNNDWDSDSDMDEPRDAQRARQEAPETVDPGETTVSEDVAMIGNDLVNDAVPAAEKMIVDEIVNPPVQEVPVNVIPVQELLLDVDTLGREFQAKSDQPEELVKDEAPVKKSPKKVKKKKKAKKPAKKSKKKHDSSSSDSESSASSSESDSSKKRKKGKKKVKKLKKKAVESSSSGSDSEADKKKKKKKNKKNDKEKDIAEKLLIDLQMKKQEVLQKLRDLENITDKKLRKTLSKSLEEESEKINQLELLILRKNKKDRKRKKSKNESTSSDSESENDKKKKKKKRKRKVSSSSESSDDGKKKKKSSKKAKTKDKHKLDVDTKNDENSIEPVTRKRPAEADIAPITLKSMFMDFASSSWIDRLNNAPAQVAEEPPKSPAEMKAPQPRIVRDVTNTLKETADNRKTRNNEWNSSSADMPSQAGAFQAITAPVLSDAVKKGIAEFRAFQAISALQPPGSEKTPLPASTQDLYSPGASESEASRSLASPSVTSSVKRKFQSTPLEPSQVLCSDSQTSTSFFNVASAEESQQVVTQVKQPIRLGNPDFYGEDDLVPPGEEPCILDMPPQALKYSYETGGVLSSSDSRGSDMSVDDDAAGRRIKSKIKSLKLQKKLKKKPSAFVSPVKYIRENFLSDNDIPDDISLSPKKQPKAPMTVESVFYQDSDSDEDEMRPPRLDFSSIFHQGSQVDNSYDDKKDYVKAQHQEKKDDDTEKSTKTDEKRSKDRKKSSSPRRVRKSSRSPDRRGSRRSVDRRDSKRYSRTPERRRRRSPSPKRKHRSPSPRRRHKDRRSRSRSRSHSPRNKRSKRRSRSRSPRRGDSPRKRNMHASDYNAEDGAGRIPVLGTTIPAPMPGSIFSGEDKPPNGTDHRLSLDQRIELELGVKLRNTPPPSELHASCYYPPYNVSHYPYAPGGVVQVGNMMDMIPSASTQRRNSTQQTNIVQVGNVLQVVPLARATAVVAPTPVAPEPPVVDVSQHPLIKAIQAERERRRKEKEARKAERDERRKARQAKRDAKHMSIAEKLKLSNSLIADLIDMKAERNEGLVLGHDMEDEELLLEALDPPSPQGPLEVIEEGNSSTAAKSILITPGSIKENSSKKNVKFADGLLPGEESESELEGVEKPVPKPKLPKEKRFKKKMKKKIKVQVVRHAVEEPAEEEDDLPPPSPPPGDPPPVMYASFPFGGQVQYPVYQIGAAVKPSLPALK